MSLLSLPEIRADHRLNTAQYDVRPDALERWEPGVRAAATDDAASISIYDSIGDNWEGTGITAKRVSAALRNIGARDLTVNVNSPGGDFFEGVAIYNLLREHKAKVTVNVMGIAASAASVIAMAGDEILMGDGAFLMIHNAWTVAIGNRHDIAQAAEVLAPFDAAMAKVYSQRAGISEAEAAALMDKETWIGAEQAVADGFATGLLDSAQVAKDTTASGSRKALALIEASMARAGYSRGARRDALKALFDGTPGAAAENAMPGAGDDVAASLQKLINALQG
ncbi:head maturation protease, ClpP-related [Paraburkholderia phenoliruptrix]|uniref:head maturation protease, ClpP-related n=1 Tax=Paraburkholderia phenoliruptrix TaxID=252970 RepID=UPI001C4F18C3|nr:head maturation protease, ClpP-related [Paraburkholderia phenoliruptrix]MBW0450850.1 Clp protease ClpP [Paraburkholderia phenoliruptrix]MBW9100943.1 Clp protease ClpP [Paraburkholderia phenoliruptrix]